MKTQTLKMWIDKADHEFKTLKYLSAVESEMIPTQINCVDRLITHLQVEYNFTPAWVDEYNQICDRYFEPMKVKRI